MAIFLNPALIQLLYLFKKNKNGNHRPTAIGAVVLKLFEQVILINIKNFLDATGNQFGFKTKHGTEYRHVCFPTRTSNFLLYYSWYSKFLCFS